MRRGSHADARLRTDTRGDDGGVREELAKGIGWSLINANQAAPPYSITSSARASSVGGMSRPSVLAVVRSMTRSNFVEARRMRVCYPSRPSARMVSCTFGLAPIRAMYALMFGHFARSILWILVQLSTVNR